MPYKAASLDGDADRLVYWKRTDGKPLVISGDKTYGLVMMYIVELLEHLGI